MKTQDLARVRNWAHNKIEENRTLPWTREHYTQLVKTLDIIIDGLENNSTAIMAEEHATD